VTEVNSAAICHILIVAMTLLSAGCQSRLSVTGPLPPSPVVESDFEAAVVGLGDVIAVGYYRNIRLRHGERYKIGVGDVLHVDIADHPEITRDKVTVLPDGRISLPLIGSIAAAGIDTEHLAAAVSRRYSDERINDPHVAVSVEDGDQRIQTFLHSLTQTLSSQNIEVTVGDASGIDLPGIPTVPVNRPFTEIRKDIRDTYRREFGADLDVTVNFRKRSGQFVFAMGEVGKPGAVEISRTLNPLTAIAAAGGVLPTGDLTKVVVVRYNNSGYDQYVFDLEKPLYFEDQKTPEFHLRPSDVIFVPKTGIADVNQVVDQYVRKMLPFPLGAGINVNP
jgi:polysaccharide export outer membrane protein